MCLSIILKKGEEKGKKKRKTIVSLTPLSVTFFLFNVLSLNTVK